MEALLSSHLRLQKRVEICDDLLVGLVPVVHRQTIKRRKRQTPFANLCQQLLRVDARQRPERSDRLGRMAAAVFIGAGDTVSAGRRSVADQDGKRLISRVLIVFKIIRRLCGKLLAKAAKTCIIIQFSGVSPA